MTRLRTGSLIVACGLVIAACAVEPNDPATPPASSVAAPSVQPSETPTSPPTSSPSAKAVLPAWTWTAATVDADDAGPIVGIWPLSGGFSAVATRSWDNDERDRATFLVSADGITWRPTPFPRKQFAYELGVLHDGSLTIVGSTGSATSPRREIWQTTDGIAWDRVEGVRGLDYGPSVMSAATPSRAGWLGVVTEIIDAETRSSHLVGSSDLRRWRELPWPEGVQDEGIASDGTSWAMLGATFAADLEGAFPLDVFQSTDGETWTSTRVATLPKHDSANAIVAMPGAWAIGGQRFDPSDESSNPIAWWSRDGVAWQESEIVRAEGLDGQANLTWMEAYAEGLLATGYGDESQAGLWLSDDGRRWTQIAPVPEGLTQIEAAARAGDDVIVSGWGDEVGLQLWRGSPPGD